MPQEIETKFIAVIDSRRFYLYEDDWDAFKHTETHVRMIRNAMFYQFDEQRELHEYQTGRIHGAVKAWLIDQATDFVYHSFNSSSRDGMIYFRAPRDAVNFRLHFHNANHTVNM